MYGDDAAAAGDARAVGLCAGDHAGDGIGAAASRGVAAEHLDRSGGDDVRHDRHFAAEFLSRFADDHLLRGQLGWLPTGGYIAFTDDPVGWLATSTMPAISLALLLVGLLARITRSTMLEVLRQDYIRTARAKGLPRRLVVVKHALANALIPITTVVGHHRQPADIRLGGDRDAVLHSRHRASC